MMSSIFKNSKNLQKPLAVLGMIGIAAFAGSANARPAPDTVVLRLEEGTVAPQDVAILTIIMCILIPGCAGGGVAMLSAPPVHTEPSLIPTLQEKIDVNASHLPVQVAGWKNALWWIII